MQIKKEYKLFKKTNRFAGKKFSILGDSISTLAGQNPKGYVVFYEGENCKKSGVKSINDTWWGQLINFFGGKLLINNSFSGSRVTGDTPFSGNSDELTGGLHKGDVMPDVIIVFLGLNDYGYGVNPHFTDADIILYEQVTNNFDLAYGLMLDKLEKNYPDAEIWCSILYRNKIKGISKPTFWECPYGFHLLQYNEVIINAVKQRNNCHLLNFARNNSDPIVYESFDGTHPTRLGMYQLASMFIYEMDEDAGNKYLSNKDNFIFPEMEYVYYKDDHYYICRLKNNQKQYIEKSDFIIGRDPNKADFNISDNEFISRYHALIIMKENKYFICDLGSKNGTYIDDVKIQPNHEVEVSTASRIRFADEEFVIGIEN